MKDDLPSPIITQDQSWTAYSPTYQETFHSISGAREECEVIFFQASQIQEKWHAAACADPPLPSFNILEVGFGLGLNWQNLQQHWLAAAAQGAVPPLVQYHALEKDTSLIEATRDHLKLPLIWQTRPPELTPVFTSNSHDQTPGLGHWFFTQKQATSTLQLFIWPGDARQVLPRLTDYLKPCQAVWQDAFSPRHNSELWTWQWFKDLAAVCAPTAIVATYSAATPVRLAMQKAGFKVASRSASQSKKASTIAALTGIADPALAAKLAASPYAAYDDHDVLSNDPSRKSET